MRGKKPYRLFASNWTRIPRMNTDQSKIKNPKSKVLWLVIPSLLLIIVLGFDLLPILRGNNEWRWPLRGLESPARLLVPIVTLGLYVSLCALWLKYFERGATSRLPCPRSGGTAGRYERWFLLFVTLAAPLFQLSLASAVSRVPLLEFFGPTVSIHNSGYFTTAVTSPDLNQLLANFPALMPQLPIHAQSHPPGAEIVHWLVWQALRAVPPLADFVAMPLRTLQCHNPGIMALDNAQIASASIGILLPLLGGLAVWPLFAFAKRVSNSSVAAITVMVFPVLPLFALWMSQWDQIYPLLLFIGLYLAHTGLEKNSWWRILAAGVPLSVASFFSVGNAVLMVIVGLYGLAWLWFQRTSLRPSISQSLRLAVAFILGCASIWLLYWLFYGVNPINVISTGSRLAFESTTGARSYGLWLLGNPIDFVVFLGLPIALLLLYNLINRVPCPKSLLPITIATFGTLIVFWLSGFVRGEVGRLWMYFGLLVVLIAVGWQDGSRLRDDTDHASRTTLYVSLIALIAVQLLIMNTRWLINDSYLDEPPERSAVMSAPNWSRPIAAAFADQIALRGYDVSQSSGVIDLTLNWQALTQPLHAYTVFAHVIDAHGQQVGQQDNMPVRDQLPTSCWLPGEYVTDPYSITIAPGAAGPFTIEIGLYRADTGARLPRSDAPGDSVTLNGP